MICIIPSCFFYNHKNICFCTSLFHHSFLTQIIRPKKKKRKPTNLFQYIISIILHHPLSVVQLHRTFRRVYSHTAIHRCVYTFLYQYINIVTNKHSGMQDNTFSLFLRNRVLPHWRSILTVAIPLILLPIPILGQNQVIINENSILKSVDYYFFFKRVHYVATSFL